MKGTNGHHKQPQEGVTVFCGSSSGTDPDYTRAAQQLGTSLARHSRTLVYGGGTKGLMGATAQAALDAGGDVHGIMPTAFLPNEGSGANETSLSQGRNKHTSVNSMHERKQLMAQSSNAFVGLPGGYGTFEEVFEAVTWTQLGIQSKPVILLNVKDFYTPLRYFVNSAISAGFIAECNRAFMIFVDEDKDDSEFDWGVAALKAIKEWRDKGMGGGKAFSLEWPEDKLKLT
ncbi:hypothetical protein OIO90_001358 [Microbotryomycetes sp. JL221]|nr:hypothetical protein OIO90_001358 [Microbotryomycetes sp. JL221]